MQASGAKFVPGAHDPFPLFFKKFFFFKNMFY